jgi:hypothetical protein
LRRVITIGTALAVLVGAAAAYAASGSFNTYAAPLKITSKGAGSKASPAPLKLEDIYNASGTNGNRAAPLTDIKTTIYGMVADGKDFPKCTDKQITADHVKWDKACPKGSMVASGTVNSLLGAANAPSSAGTPCNLILHVYNGGQGVIWFFFVIQPPKYTCATLTTGASAPYKGTYKVVGPNFVQDTPLPPDVSTRAGNLQGVYGSLIHEDLTYRPTTKTVSGKTVVSQASVACKAGKRPYSVAFTAQNYNGQSGTTTIVGKPKC